jgi:calcineurin-like phosphoesterase family protein
MQNAIDSKNEVFVVGIFPSGLKSDKRITDLLAALNGDKGLIHAIDGFSGMAEILQEFLLDECL